MKNIHTILLLIIIIIVSLYTSYSNYTEEFTPYLREMYRPQLRKLRLFSEDFYNNQKKNIHIYLKKTGLI